jgi:hypothetical protein
LEKHEDITVLAPLKSAMRPRGEAWPNPSKCQVRKAEEMANEQRGDERDCDVEAIVGTRDTLRNDIQSDHNVNGDMFSKECI